MEFIYIYLIFFVICLFVVVKSGLVLVKSLLAMARYLKLSEYVLAFILMAFATSVPELFVGINSALSDKSILSFGNIIGANFVKLTLALGLVILIARGIKVKKDVPKKDAWIIFFLAMLPVLLALDGVLSRMDGVILIFIFIWYITRLLGRQEETVKKLKSDEINLINFKDFIKDFLFFIVGVFFLLLGSWGVVWAAENLASLLEVSLIFIGLILLSVGTTLPELSFGIRSALLKHESMTLGNFIGAIACNSLFILGLVALIRPVIILELEIVIISGLFLALALILFNIFIRTENKLSLREGSILLILFFFFFVVQIILS